MKMFKVGSSVIVIINVKFVQESAVRTIAIIPSRTKFYVNKIFFVCCSIALCKIYTLLRDENLEFYDTNFYNFLAKQIILSLI